MLLRAHMNLGKSSEQILMHGQKQVGWQCIEFRVARDVGDVQRRWMETHLRLARILLRGEGAYLEEIKWLSSSLHNVFCGKKSA